MSGVNRVILIGRLGKDPESKQLPSGNTVTDLVLATSETWRDKQTGEKQEKTTWHNVTFFGKVAEIAAQYLTKGSKIYLEGSIETQTWENAEGVKQYKTIIKGRELQFLDRKGASDNAPQQQQAPMSKQAPSDGMDESFKDDILF